LSLSWLLLSGFCCFAIASAITCGFLGPEEDEEPFLGQGRWFWRYSIAAAVGLALLLIREALI
jgi:hypothetical protein